MEDSLFRMNFIVQDNAAMTLETNLVRIIEAVLFEERTIKCDRTFLVKKIKEEFELSFTEDEIQHAIIKKGKNIITISDYYELKPEYRERLEKQEDFATQLDNFVNRAINELEMEVSADKLVKLLKDYLYYCFNSNKNSILALLGNEEVHVNNFTRDEEDERLINTFLNWKNEEKNRFIYNFVSYGYIYCTLTVKKDELLANRLFRGKKFVLDANIIFRLAGINNDVRMNTIKSFVEKAKEVGVSLCYTTATLKEIERVIVNKVKWIMSVTGNQEPLDLSEYDYSQNDFYSIYCQWSNSSANKYNDFLAFQKYLTNLIMQVLDKLQAIESPNFEMANQSEFNQLVTSLTEYKREHSVKQKPGSIKTDINNILHIRRLRNRNKNENIWSTNIFFISADQNLIKWCSDETFGVPLVVLPSVWLTIMLRFSGRTANDYKAFCSFLELRTHQQENVIDVYGLLQNLSERTNSNELKRMVVKEVFEHKSDYTDYSDGNYDNVVDKAFDVILSEREAEEKSKLENLINKHDAEVQRYKEYELQRLLDEEMKIRKLVDKDGKKHFRVAKFANAIKWPTSFVLFVVLLLNTIFAFRGKGLILYVLDKVYVDFTKGVGDLLGILGLIWAITTVLAGFICVFLQYLCSEKRVIKYKKKREQYYRNLFQREDFGE